MRQETLTYGKEHASGNTIGIQIGDIRCSLKCEDAELIKNLRDIHHDFLTEQPPDITIELEESELQYLNSFGNSLFRFWNNSSIKYFRVKGWMTDSGYDPERKTFSIVAEKNRSDPRHRYRYLNRLLSLAYYRAYKFKYDIKPPAMFVRACGVLINGQTILYTGSDESGKATIARLCMESDIPVINDEMVLVSRPDPENPITVRGIPVIGRALPCRNGAAPLSRLIFLKKSHRTWLNSIDKTDAYFNLMKHVISPADSGHESDREPLSMVADFCSGITGAIPVHELEFKRDKELLRNVILEIGEKSGEK